MPNEDEGGEVVPLAPFFDEVKFGKLLCKAFGGPGSSWSSEKAPASELTWFYVDDPIGDTLEVMVSGNIDPFFGHTPFVLVELDREDLPHAEHRRLAGRIERLGKKCVLPGAIMGWP